MPTYSYTNLKDQIANTATLANISNELTILDVINRAVRMVNNDIDLRSLRRKSQLARLFDDVYIYTCPTDLKGEAIIDISPQANRKSSQQLRKVTLEKFDRLKQFDKGMVCVADDDFARTILASMDVNDTVETLSSLDSTDAGGGTWSAYGDATSLAADTDRYVEGGGSLKFNLAGAGTTAGIENTTLDEIDITAYVSDGSVFVWAYVVSTTNLTNFILQIGNDLTTNYYTQTVTTQADGTAFQAGVNLLRFDFASMTQNGTVTPTTVDSVRLYMTKTSGKTGTAYRFDGLILHTGEYHDLTYYSKYGWQTSAGVYIENSTTTTDKLNADTDEFDLYVMKGKVEMYRELESFEQMDRAESKYLEMASSYRKRYPSQALKYETNY